MVENHLSCHIHTFFLFIGFMTFAVIDYCYYVKEIFPFKFGQET